MRLTNDDFAVIATAVNTQKTVAENNLREAAEALDLDRIRDASVTLAGVESVLVKLNARLAKKNGSSEQQHDTNEQTGSTDEQTGDSASY